MTDDTTARARAEAERRWSDGPEWRTPSTAHRDGFVAGAEWQHAQDAETIAALRAEVAAVTGAFGDAPTWHQEADAWRRIWSREVAARKAAEAERDALREAITAAWEALRPIRAALSDPTPIVQAWPMEDPPGNGPVSDAGTRSAQGHRGGPESGSDAAGRADSGHGAIVTSGDLLDALPDGSAIGLVRRGEFRAFRKSGERWEDERGVRFDEDWLPVRLLYVGEWQGDE